MISRLHAIVDVEVSEGAGWRAADLARAYLDGGARLLQLRAKKLRSAAFLSLCDDLLEAAAACGAQVIVNDRVDVARLSGATGAHVGQDDIPPHAARAQLGSHAIVGVSTHTSAQIEAAAATPVTYIAVGPVFATATKATGYAAVGVDLVRAAVTLTRSLPVVAIGGITLNKAPEVIAAGASAVAVIGDLLSTGDPAARVRAYLDALEAPQPRIPHV